MGKAGRGREQCGRSQGWEWGRGCWNPKRFRVEKKQDLFSALEQDGRPGAMMTWLRRKAF